MIKGIGGIAFVITKILNSKHSGNSIKYPMGALYVYLRLRINYNATPTG